MRHPFALAVLVGLTLSPSAVFARERPDWPYPRLFNEADLVVVAVAVKTAAVDATPPPGNTTPWELVGRQTTFKVLHALKGEAGKEMGVLHFDFGRLKDGRSEDEGLTNGPNLVAFPTERRDGPAPEFLLFLRKTDRGLEPVSGQVDPAYSVRRLSEAPEPVLPWDRPKSHAARRRASTRNPRR